MPLNRRELPSRSALAAAGVMLIGSVDVLLTAPGAVTGTAATGGAVGYGPLVPDPKGIRALPEGFSYRIPTGAFAAGGDDDDAVTPLVNNHAAPHGRR
ncbi:hypothetical protein [Streptomyces lomondensis]|uniref:Uncharacterized protein n=1 Tax=Streptomyces lomondensis TaxID=68229 RepID=A0ABQ2XTH6_9ACTN|nr:hypothetical protein [Streptomyces lomondensis]MCF0082452.1 PhoX family protein [Streptomyces lomondensis]GGX33617.1 hypothetical protein GCM10010383_74900 [Streptomyces lomondensis]